MTVLSTDNIYLRRIRQYCFLSSQECLFEIFTVNLSRTLLIIEIEQFWHIVFLRKAKMRNSKRNLAQIK